MRSSQPAQELEQKARVTAEELESSVKNIVAEGKDKARTAAKDIERNVKDAVTAGKDKARTTVGVEMSALGRLVTIFICAAQ